VAVSEEAQDALAHVSGALKVVGRDAFRCNSLNTISSWSSQDALTGSQWRWTGKGCSNALNQTGRRRGACVEPLSRTRWRPRIRRHQTLPKRDEALALKAARQGFVGVHQPTAEQLHCPVALVRRILQGSAGPGYAAAISVPSNPGRPPPGR
jgi:hypothetical protein